MCVWAENLLPDRLCLASVNPMGELRIGGNFRRTLILLYLFFFFLVNEFIMDDVFVNLSQWALFVF